MPSCPVPTGDWPPPGRTPSSSWSAPSRPPCVQAIGAEAAALGVPVLDCGVTGGPAAAATGDLVCMVGGDPAVIERVGPVFDAISSLTVTMGPFGSGLAAKLARNLITYGSWLAAYEGQQLAEAAGIDLAKLAEVVKASDVHIGGASRLMFRSTVAPFTDEDDKGLVGAMQAGAALAHKDLAAALELADSLEVDLPLAAMTEHRTDEIFGVGRDGHMTAAASRVAGEERHADRRGAPAGPVGPDLRDGQPGHRGGPSAWWPTAGPRTSTTPSPPPAGPSTRPAGPPTSSCGCGASASCRRPSPPTPTSSGP